MKSTAIVFCAALLSACAAPGESTATKPTTAVNVSSAVREQCQREALQMYPVSMKMAENFDAPGTPAPQGVAAAYGPHPSAVDENVRERANKVTECLHEKAYVAK